MSPLHQDTPTKTKLSVCPVEGLADGQRQIVHHGAISIGVFNVRGRYYAVRNQCPHEKAPLCQGPLTGTNSETDKAGEMNWGSCGYILRCPWHAWEFDIRDGKSFTGTKLRVKTYPVEVIDGNLTVIL
ncbi:MAG: Rieske 2Fe-2S domain-containing protein [Opitutales bacterium]|nr:Rieske 2Fe-2S domain-containing protein [Opitutales bacterium]NRA28008.1 Rieske 2Fe-2S domain-containing protein [Opitutales bacterium]